MCPDSKRLQITLSDNSRGCLPHCAFSCVAHGINAQWECMRGHTLAHVSVYLWL